MRNFTTVIILLIVFVYVNKHYYPRSVTQASNPLSHILHPFDRTVHYRIGQVDPRFNLSESQLLQLAQQATDIWHQGSHKSLFVYDPSASLAINLIYDQRQAETTLRATARQKLDNEHTNQQQNASQFEQQQQVLQREHLQIEARHIEFQRKKENYNRNVESLNTLGKIDDYTRQQIAQQRASLDLEQQEIQAAINTYNQHVGDINQNADSLNQQAQHYNQTVDQYRARFTPRNFEKGVYDGHQINIYEFGSTDELRLAIAHELGHALGIQHNSDPYALMYPVMQKQNIENFHLTAADLAMLPK